MIRFAGVEDGPVLLKIYAQYIETAVTFECALPKETEFSQRIEEISQDYPYLVWEEDGRIIGYAYAHRYKEREAYQWTAELSVYVDQKSAVRGVGRRFYQMLLAILKRQGVRTVYGIVTVPNEKSEKLHKVFGFQRIGVYHSIGYKCGRWHDVALFEKKLLTGDSEPEPFLPIHLLSHEELSAVLLEQM
ncbi:GNAT family N-acetyltransferase [Enterococcus sp. LJL51]|uniref:GNAT family N-acetyltransferase n=1 Tax=Enterococcus sp. LJL51 TaxID=3416656 RepID=UPI003CF81736